MGIIGQSWENTGNMLEQRIITHGGFNVENYLCMMDFPLPWLCLVGDLAQTFPVENAPGFL